MSLACYCWWRRKLISEDAVDCRQSLLEILRKNFMVSLPRNIDTFTAQTQSWLCYAFIWYKNIEICVCFFIHPADVVTTMAVCTYSARLIVTALVLRSQSCVDVSNVKSTNSFYVLFEGLSCHCLGWTDSFKRHVFFFMYCWPCILVICNFIFQLDAQFLY